MANLVEAVVTAVMGQLVPNVTLASVYSVVPDNTKPPVVVVSDGTWEQAGGKAGNAERHEVIVRCIIGGTSKADLFALMQEVKDALHQQQLTSTVAALGRCVMTSGNEIRDIDDNALVGEQRFLVFASPL